MVRATLLFVIAFHCLLAYLLNAVAAAECHLRMAEHSLVSTLPWEEVNKHLDQAIRIGLSQSQRAVVEQATFYKVYSAVRLFW
jgi:hypothetical protein